MQGIVKGGNNNGGLNYSDRQTLITIANQADSNNSTIKQNVVTALATRGISALATDPWTSLVSKMNVDPDVQASNILNGVTIDGVTGNITPNVLTPGDTLLYSGSSYTIANATPMAKMMEVQINGVGGVVRVKVQLNSANAGNTVYCQVYKNNVATGAIHSVVNSMQWFQDDITVVPGDKIELYGYETNQTYSGYVNAWGIYTLNPLPYITKLL